MRQVRAVFQRKPVELTTKICQIEQVVELPADEYKRFSEKLYMSQPFIRENAEAMYQDSQGVNHCLLVLGEGQEDGILVESEGADYARYAAYLSNARSFVLMERYPALKQFGTQMINAVGWCVERILEEQLNGRTEMSVKRIEEEAGLKLFNQGLFFDMLAQREEVSRIRFDGEQDAFEVTISKDFVAEEENELRM